MNILTDDEIMAVLPGAVRLPPGWELTARAIESAVLAKLARGVELPEPAYWRNRVDSYSVLSKEDKETNAFQYSEEFLAGHTDPLYTADQLYTALAAMRVKTLHDAMQAAGPEDSYQDEWFKAKCKAVEQIRALIGKEAP